MTGLKKKGRGQSRILDQPSLISEEIEVCYSTKEFEKSVRSLAIAY